MRVFFYLLVLILLPVGVFAQHLESLELTDGYFQAGDRKPVHLTHELGDFKGQVILSSEVVHFWYTVSIRPGEHNLCDDSSNVACVASLSFVSLKDSNNLTYYAKDSTRLSNDEFSIVYSFILDQTKTAKGPGIFMFTVEKYGQIIFLHQTPVEIK